jgi:2'-5' RNA ligase
MVDTIRSFIAIAVPDPVERALSRWQAELAPELPSCRWTPALPLHITLVFLGETTQEERMAIDKAVGPALVTLEPWEIEIAGLGAFPSLARPRVLWAGVAAPGHARLIESHRLVMGALAEIDIRPDDTRFHPHVTLGRFKYGSSPTLSRLKPSHIEQSAGRFPVTAVGLYGSTLGQSGAHYVRLGHYPLGGWKSEVRA